MERNRSGSRRIAVIGANGMLGLGIEQYFRYKGSITKGIRREDFDIVKDAFDKLVSLVDDCEIVINCAGVIKPLISRTPLEEVLRVNVGFPRNLAKACAARGISCFHVTTDCAFSGRKGGYSEEDFLDAEDIYGLSKIGGETADCMTVRTSIIGEERGQARCLLEWARSQAGQEISGFVNHIWNGVTTVHLAEIVERIISRGLYRRGVFHIFSPEKVSKYSLLEMISRIYGFGLKIKPMETPVSCDRSLSSIFPLSSIVATKPLEIQIREMKELFSLASR